MNEEKRIFRRLKKPKNLRNKNNLLNKTIETKIENEEDDVEYVL